ncbi:MAG: histidine phosphatase family protein [Pseudomonadota bacterium]
MPLAVDVTLYVIRHGQTDWNRDRRLQGQIDIPINALGREQAAHNGRALRHADVPLDTLDFVASPLSRTTETMEILREAAGLPRAGFATDPRLKEIKYGDWEGALLSELKASDPAGYRERNANKYYWRPNNGESYAELSERVDGWLSEVERDAVVVTHGGVTRVLRGLVQPMTQNDVPNQIVPQDRVLVLRHDGHAWLDGQPDEIASA